MLTVQEVAELGWLVHGQNVVEHCLGEDKSKDRRRSIIVLPLMLSDSVETFMKYYWFVCSLFFLPIVHLFTEGSLGTAITPSGLR